VTHWAKEKAESTTNSKHRKGSILCSICGPARHRRSFNTRERESALVRACHLNHDDQARERAHDREVVQQLEPRQQNEEGQHLKLRVGARCDQPGRAWWTQARRRLARHGLPRTHVAPLGKPLLAVQFTFDSSDQLFTWSAKTVIIS
jgi:hypothetical protein